MIRLLIFVSILIPRDGVDAPEWQIHRFEDPVSYATFTECERHKKPMLEAFMAALGHQGIEARAVGTTCTSVVR